MIMAYVNPTFRSSRRTWDITATRDGYDIVSRRFRDFCLEHAWHGMSFVPLLADEDFFVMQLSQVVHVDAERMNVRVAEHCPLCKHPFEVMGASPTYLRSVDRPIEEGFYQSDLEFGCGHEQSPLVLVGVNTATAIEQQGFGKCDLEPVYE